MVGHKYKSKLFMYSIAHIQRKTYPVDVEVSAFAYTYV